jgi:anaerobic selenocysteine-containing dehydrogenase
VNASPHTVVHRSCNLCEAHCGVSITVDPDAGRVLDIRGDPDDALSRGYVCPKAVALESLSTDPDRLRAPVKRVGDRFVEIGWDEAYALVASRLLEIRERHGANAIATYLGNPSAHDFAANLAIPPLLRALGTRWRFSATSVDQLPKWVSAATMFGSIAVLPIPDIDRTDYFLVLGANPLASNGSLMTAPDMRRRLRELRARGGKLVVVDPRRTETAEVADRHLALRPGTDALFLFAMVHVLFEESLVAPGRLADFTNGVDEVRALAREFSPERVARATGLPAAAIREVARELAAAPMAVCYGRIGTCTQEFGALASWLVDVVNVLTGNLDRPGGAMLPWTAHEPADPTPRRRGHLPYARWKSRVRGLPEFGGELPVATLAEEIDTPGDDRVRALVTLAGNPVCSTPNADRLDRALGTLDFLVSIDLYVNETTRHAHVILPTSAPLERANYDMAFHANSVRQHAKWSPAVLPPPPGVRHLWEVAMELAGRLAGAAKADAEEVVLVSLLAATTGPGSACPDVTAAQAREILAKWEGPERVLDLMLRAGRFGDRFRGDGSGLSLQALVDAVHGIDLGPLEPRLPARLATASGRIELAPPLLVSDLPRLRGALDREPPDLVLIGRRQMRTNNSWMHNVPALAKGRDRCTLRVHPDDAAARGIRHGDRASIRSRVGCVEARVEVSDEMRPGVVSLPHGFGHDVPGAQLRVAKTLQPGVNTNRLTDETGLDALSCNAILNGIPVELAPAGEIG